MENNNDLVDDTNTFLVSSYLLILQVTCQFVLTEPVFIFLNGCIHTGG